MPAPVQFEIPRNTSYSVIILPLTTLAQIADGDIVTSFVPGFVGSIVRTFFVTGTVPASTGGKGSTLNFEIGTVNLVGGVITLTSALCTPMGAVIQGTAVSGSNKFDKDDVISVEASSTTAFSEGNGSVGFVVAIPIF